MKPLKIAVVFLFGWNEWKKKRENFVLFKLLPNFKISADSWWVLVRMMRLVEACFLAVWKKQN